MPQPVDLILITGASGFIGKTVLPVLARNYRMVALERICPSVLPANVHCIPCDLASTASVRQALDAVWWQFGIRIASVLHLAGYYDFTGVSNPEYDEINVLGTERLLLALQPFQVDQFVYASTMLVHAPTTPGQPINESWPLAPKWVYPKSKLRAEGIIRAFHGRIPYVIARLAGVYDDWCHLPALAHQIQRIYERTLDSHLFPGNRAHGQAALHLQDLVEVMVRMVNMRRQLPPAMEVLIGETDTVSYEDLQNEIGRLIHGEAWSTTEVARPLARAAAWIEESLSGEKPFIRPFMMDIADDHYALDIASARSLLGWQPQHSLRRSLWAMIEALRVAPAEWYRVNHLSPARRERPAFPSYS